MNNHLPPMNPLNVECVKSPQDPLKEYKMLPPFKKRRRFNHGRFYFYDFTTIPFPDGVNRILTSCNDNYLRLYRLDNNKIEKKMVYEKAQVYGIHYYKEQKLLLSIDSDGILMIWNVFPEFKFLKRYTFYDVPYTFVEIWRILQISENEFVCGERYGRNKGVFRKITFDPKKQDFEIAEMFNTGSGVFFIIQLKSEKESIVFSNGHGGGDDEIRKYNLKKKKSMVFPSQHDGGIVCLTSYYNNQNTEMILSAGEHDGIIIWTTDAKVQKEIKIDFEVCLFQRKSKKIIFALRNEKKENFSWNRVGRDFYTYSLETEKQENIMKNVHEKDMYCMKWIDDEESKFITCSEDETFNIFELESFESSEFEKKDLEERISFFQDDYFLDSLPKNNKSIFINFKLRNVEFEKLLRVLFL